jgi:hypothetical protein
MNYTANTGAARIAISSARIKTVAMSETDIVFQSATYLDRLWSLQQWWASISIGVLIMAHLAAERLNLFLVCISLALYTVYSLYMTHMLRENADSLFALLDDLRGMVESGQASSSHAVALLEIPDTTNVLFMLTFGGTYLCVVAYVVFCYYRARGRKNW